MKKIFDELIKIAREKGYTDTEIAKHLHTTQSSITRAVHANNVGIKLTSKLADFLGYIIDIKLKIK